MSYTLLDEPSINLLPSLFLLTNSTRQANNNNQQIEIPLEEFEDRLQELFQQRNQTIQPNKNIEIEPIELRDIPTQEVVDFCNDYKNNKQKLDNISKVINNISNDKHIIEDAYKDISEKIKILVNFVKDDNECSELYLILVNKTLDLYNKCKDKICKDEPTLLNEQSKICRYISDSILLFNLVKSETKSSNIEKEDILNCPVCYEQNINMVYTSCGHCICNGCSKKVQQNLCIICRKKSRIIPLYLSGN
jgi:hypothetical protein